MVSRLEHYLAVYGDDGKILLNDVCPNHTITLAAANIEEAYKHTSCDIKDGSFRILFREKNLGVNTYDANYNFADAVSAAAAAL